VDYRLDTQALHAHLVSLQDLQWLFANLGLDPRYRDWFRHRAWVRTIHGTTRIEGNSLNDLEVAPAWRRGQPAFGDRRRDRAHADARARRP